VGLGVSQVYRHKGIAKKLMNSFIEAVRSHFSLKCYMLRVVYLFMEVNNEIAQIFYKNLNFNKIATIPSFYPHVGAELWIKYF
jgi:ribosomal protein S18 acetylase RimI-like enzyme